MSTSASSVLVVEDDPSSRHLIREILSRRGFHVETCADAETALAEAQLQPFEMAVLDIHLPGMDGIELCRRLRKLPQGEEIVVIFLTGAESPDELQRALDAGADDYVVKPVNGPNLPVRLALAERLLYFRKHRRRSEEQLTQDALHDTVTHLVNRTLFLERLDRIAEHARRENQRGAKESVYHYAILYLNLDGFGRVNTQHGYDAGNEVLRQVAERLEKCIRGVDTVSRFGGDEFVILLDDMSDVSGPTRVVRRIEAAFTSPFVVEDTQRHLTASVGVALNVIGSEDPRTLLSDARKALFRAKAHGPGSYEMFDEAVHARAVERLQLESRLRSAVEAGEMVLHYQPIVALDTGRIRGFEALVRWQEPGGRLVQPGEFIQVAEDTGIIVPLGWWALGEAARQLGVWHQMGEADDSLFVCVNVSARQFARAEIVGRISEAVESAGIPRGSLHVEITETALMSDLEGTRQVLERLKAVDVKVHVDDFGTGYSSLSYLVRLPIDSLKIDRSFVNEITESPENLEVVRTITQLAENLNLSVIAEGVETERQLAALRGLQCAFGQGFLFGKPRPPNALGDLVRNRMTLA